MSNKQTKTEAPKKSKNVSKVMAIIGWAIITLAVTFGGGMYAGHSLAQPAPIQTVQAPKA